VAGIRVEKPTEVGDAVKKALGLNRPALIEVRVGRMPRPPFFMQLKAPDKYKK
jgi:thiamine pyrophosphate-dependent acetolactate synthase large subunit-like protein